MDMLMSNPLLMDWLHFEIVNNGAVNSLYVSLGRHQWNTTQTELLLRVAWMNLIDIMMSKRSQTHKSKYSVNLFM